MPFIDLSILNQRQTPAFYADVLANRPPAGFVGRIFISTNTFAFFRDNGTGWDLIGGPGTGTVTGSGAAGQVSFWNGASSITGSNDLFWDSVNGHLGIGTNVPGTALQIDHDQNQFIRLNQTTATNDTKIAFQNSGIALWRIGNSYNAGANDFGIYDVLGSIQPVTVKKTTGQVLIGTSTVGSGKLVVASATSDNHIQIVGAAAPSLRIDSAESGPTKRIGIGLATAVNNFIQNSQNLDMCIFNGSTSAAGNMLFGIYDTGLANIQEAARISSARNFLIGTIVDAGQKLQVSGTSLITGVALFSNFVGVNGSPANGFPLEAYINSSTAYTTSSRGNVFRVFNSSTSANIFAGIELGGSGPANDGLAGLNGVLTSTGSAALTFYTRNANTFAEKMRISADGNIGFGTSTPNAYPNYTTLTIDGLNGSEIDFDANGVLVADMFSSSAQFNIRTVTSIPLIFSTAASERARFTSSGNLLIGTTTDGGYRLNVNGSALIQGRIVSTYTTNDSINVEIGNSNSQGSAQKRTIVRQYSAVTSGNKLIIPFNAQNNLNSTTICKVYGHSARYNNRIPLGFEINFSVGSLSLLENLTSWGGGGNFSAISISGMTIEIDFTTAYTSGTSDGIFVTIEYMTNNESYSIDVPNITMN